jgi:predicted phage tail protein
VVKTKNAGKKESVVRSVLGGILITLSFLISGIFWLGMGFIGAIVAISALFKY